MGIMESCFLFAMFSQLFVLSGRGDVLLFKDYRNELPHNTPEQFFSKISGGILSPFVQIGGLNFVSVVAGGVYFVGVITSSKDSPSQATSFLDNLIRILRDYCGTIGESSLRTNFVLAYEILDEVIDYGFIQNCSTVDLKPLIKNEAVSQFNSRNQLLEDVLKIKTKESTAAARPISISVEDDRNRKNEMYLDLIERLTVSFNSSGETMRADIYGSLVLKSYLKGNPEVQIGLSHDLYVKTRNSETPSSRDCVILDDINFHPCVNQESFDLDKSIHFFPGAGETTVLNYRLHEAFSPPFTCFTQLEEIGPNMVDLLIKLRPIFPAKNSATNLVMTFNAPSGVESISFSMKTNYEDTEDELEHQSATFQRQQNKIIWKLGKVFGGFEEILRVKFNWDKKETEQNIVKEIGSFLLDFEIPMYLCSKLKIRYLHIMERSSDYEPDRWVRYLSQADSYRFRI